MSADSVAADQIRAFFDRWQRLEEEKTAISGDLKELFAEAKANGFDTKVLRKLFRDQVADSNERSEFEALYDLYASALNAPRVRDARDAREDDHSAATKAKRSAALDALAALDADIIDADGVVIEPQPQAAQTGRLHNASFLAAWRGAVESPATVLKQEPSVEADRDGGADELGGEEGSQSPLPSDRVEKASDGPTVIAAAPHSHPVTIPAADPTVVVTASDRSAASPSAAPVADHSRPNPICRDPDDCGVYASWHLPCERCLKAAEEAA